VVVLRILGWNLDRAWVDWPVYYRRDLEWRLSRLTDLDKTSIRHLARQIRDLECTEIPLRKAKDAMDGETLRLFLEGVGADTIIVTALDNTD
jgi:hypothetical protein